MVDKDTALQLARFGFLAVTEPYGTIEERIREILLEPGLIDEETAAAFKEEFIDKWKRWEK